MQAASVFSARQADFSRLDYWQFDFNVWFGFGVFGASPTNTPLASAARQLGLGRPAQDYRLEGAREVRLAGRARPCAIASCAN